jgi:hypothetical protein
MTEQPNPPVAKRPTPEARKVLLETLWKQIESQDKQFDSLRMLSSILLGAAGVVLTQVLRIDPEPGTPILTWLVLWGAIASSVAALSAVFVATPAILHRDPKPQGLVDHYYSRPVEDIEEQLITQLARSYHESEPVTKWMARLLKLSAGSLGLAVVVLLFAAVAKWSVQTAPVRTQLPVQVTVSARVDTSGHALTPAESLTSEGRRSP